MVDRSSGEFECHGNIYTNEEILRLLPELRRDTHQPVTSQAMNQWIITGAKTERQDFDAGATMQVRFTLCHFCRH